MADMGHEMCQLFPALGMFSLGPWLHGPWSPVPAVSFPCLSPFLCVLCSEDCISLGRGWHYSELYIASLLSAQTCASPSMPYGQTSGSQAHANISCAASMKSKHPLPLVPRTFLRDLSPADHEIVLHHTLFRSSQLWASYVTHARSVFCLCEMGNLLSRAHRKIFRNPTGDLADTAQSKGNLAGGYCFLFFFPLLFVLNWTKKSWTS